MSHRTNPDPTAEIRIETELPALPAEGKARLRKLEAFLRELPEEEFDFCEVVSRHENQCGTVCCAMGWTPKLFPDLVYWTEKGNGDLVVRSRLNPDGGWRKAAEELFGIPWEIASSVFSPFGQRSVHQSLPRCGFCASAGEVADLIAAYIRLTETPRPCTQPS